MSKTASFFAGIAVGVFLEQTYKLPRIQWLVERFREWEEKQRRS